MFPKCSNLYRLETLECFFQARLDCSDHTLHDYDQCFDGAATAFANVLNALDAKPRQDEDETEDVTTTVDPPVSHSIHDAVAT